MQRHEKDGQKITKNKQLPKKMKIQLFLLHACYFLLSKEDTLYYVFFVVVGNLVSNSENEAKEICSFQQKSHFLFLGELPTWFPNKALLDDWDL